MEKSAKAFDFVYKTRSVISKNSRGEHKIVYSDWTPRIKHPTPPNVLFCVHGLTGNGNDFDFLASQLQKKNYRIISIDLPGRGRSDFLPNPLDYNYDQYCTDIKAVLSDIHMNKAETIDWLGVSLGGLLGFRLAADAKSPIRRLIINDVGPEVPQSALAFIYKVIRKTYTFSDIKAFESRLRATRGLTWGPMNDIHWQHMVMHNHRFIKAGLIFKRRKITYAYDPKISQIFKTSPTGAQDLWPAWKTIKCPSLVLRGEKSLLLTKEIVQKMLETKNPMAQIDAHIFSDCGHVPSLMQNNQIKIIENWLERTTP